MKRTDLPDRFQKLLRCSRYVTIATSCADGQPWNTPVVGAFDDDLNLYWISWTKNQHSRNIARDDRIFVVVYDTQAPEGQGEGLYFQMKAVALETPQAVARALDTYDASFFRLANGKLPTFLHDCPSRIYQAVPLSVWHNQDGGQNGHFVDVRRRLLPVVV